MNTFDIFVAYVSWGESGKKRPVLILSQTKKSIVVFNITTRYENKSETIRNKYFKIDEWQKAGLDRQSYIDTNTTLTLPYSSVDAENPIGMLTKPDVQRLIEFLSE